MGDSTRKLKKADEGHFVEILSYPGSNPGKGIYHAGVHQLKFEMDFADNGVLVCVNINAKGQRMTNKFRLDPDFIGDDFQGFEMTLDKRPNFKAVFVPLNAEISGRLLPADTIESFGTFCERATVDQILPFQRVQDSQGNELFEL